MNPGMAALCTSTDEPYHEVGHFLKTHLLLPKRSGTVGLKLTPCMYPTSTE